MNSIGKGVGKIIWNHVMSIALTLFLMLFVFSWLLGGELVWELVLGVAMTYIYALMMYSAGWNFGRLDSRRTADSGVNGEEKFLHGENPIVRRKRVITASLLATIPSLILLGFRIAAPSMFSEAAVFIIHFAYFVWMPPCFAFFSSLGTAYSPVTLGYFLPILIMPVFVVFGYIVGLKRFSVIEKVFPKILYKREKKRKD